MKKAFVLFFVLIMFLSFVACSGKGQTKTSPDTADALGTEMTPDQSESLWYVDYYVDDFGDKGNDAYVRCNTIEGTFSNTATSGSPLSVVLYYAPHFMDPDMYYISDGSLRMSNDAANLYSIRLLEYNDTPATYSSRDRIILKCKIDGNTYSEEINGSAPNDDLFFYINCFKSNSDALTALNSAMFEGKEIKCVIEIGNSKYSFTIPETEEPELRTLCNSLNEERDEYLRGK